LADILKRAFGNVSAFDTGGASLKLSGIKAPLSTRRDRSTVNPERRRRCLPTWSAELAPAEL